MATTEKRKPKSEINYKIQLNEEQKLVKQGVFEKDVTIVLGKAASGKTQVATLTALDMLFKRHVERIIISRPVVRDSLGFIPGPQPLTAGVLTSKGWKEMGGLTTDDLVIAEDGTPKRILEIFETGLKDIYKITLDDGSFTEASADHSWFTTTREEQKRGKKGKVRTTEEILNTLLDKNGKPNYRLPRNKAVEYNTLDSLPLDPYVLGAILGDGSISNSVSLCNTDSDIIERVRKSLLEIGYNLTSPTGDNVCYTIRSEGESYNKKPARKVLITDGEDETIYDSVGLASANYRHINRRTFADRCSTGKEYDGVKSEFIGEAPIYTNKIKNILHELGLTGKNHLSKFIPRIYLTSSIQDRIDLLRGLMDTDGTVKESTGEASYCTTSLELANGIIELVRSLGGRAKLKRRNRVGKCSKIKNRHVRSRHLCYEFNVSLPSEINPFYCSRKKLRFDKRTRVKSYITYPKIVSIDYVGRKDTRCILVDSESHLYLTDNFIVTHNTMENKMEGRVAPIKQCLYQAYDPVKIDKLIEEKVIQILPIDYMKGVTFSNAVVIIDEFEDLSYEDYILTLTRLGKDSKLIYTGSAEQIDRTVKSSCISKVLLLKDSPLVNFHVLESNHRNPVIFEIIKTMEDGTQSS